MSPGCRPRVKHATERLAAPKPRKAPKPQAVSSNPLLGSEPSSSRQTLTECNELACRQDPSSEKVFQLRSAAVSNERTLVVCDEYIASLPRMRVKHHGVAKLPPFSFGEIRAIAWPWK